MIFNSVAGLIRFLGVLSNIGYLVPFCDYQHDMNKKGFTKHIHCYPCTISIDDNNNITLVFNDKQNKYEIFLAKGLV